jgi:hypothetical protein
MSSNHPEQMLSYPNPMLDFMPSARQYAAAKSMENVGRSCGGLHFPDVLAPWGAPESGDGVNADAGLMSNGCARSLRNATDLILLQLDCQALVDGSAPV